MYLHELLQEPGGRAAKELLHLYKEIINSGVGVSGLPRPILDVYLVGWASICGFHRPAHLANHLYTSGFGGTLNAATAVVTVGKSTGLLFGLLDHSYTPTALFSEYFS
jgi:hypothetical protein